ncbi:MAG: radical SAM protein, partial [Bacteroidales bacterium]|nr:radical SAM protein [Bacteroidales bacterium]
MKKIVLNPDYYLRTDEKRTFIINRNTFKNNSSYGWYSVLHPIHAIVFAFFTKNEDFETVIAKIAEFLSKTIEEVEKLITPFINNPEDVFVEHQGIRFEIPSNVLIETENDIVYHREYNIEDFIFEENDFKTKRYFKAPLNMTFMPNNTCVTNCEYCYCDKDHKVEKLLPYERLLKIMDEAQELEMLNFGVVGGEVFTYPHWRKLLKEIKDRDFELSMMSTKVPITLDDIKYLKSLGIDEIQISIDSLIFDEMKTLVKVNETYHKKIKETVKNLCNEGFAVQIATILTKYNCSKASIDSVLKLINDCGVGSWSISPGFESLYRPKQSFRTT